MFAIIRVDDRVICLVGEASTKNGANRIIYDELLEIYDGNEDELINDIENNEAEYCDSDMFAWSNRGGDHDIQACWI